ncbi:Myc-type basic helix-loop-helix (bHLH) domain [Trinorchestia longiramus]|nr:Myc-type basic helix-loop-helix (bHLH) domain [Trinorchestia longiramus]
MSDDDKDIDIESDCEEEEDNLNGVGALRGNTDGSHANKRAHHNALERKRRDHIKDSFTSLRDCVPALQGEKSSRAQILKKASDYIDFMRKKISAHQADIEDLQRQNELLEAQIKSLERAKYTGNFAAMSGGCDAAKLTGQDDYSGASSSDDADEDDLDDPAFSRRKRLKS